MSSLVSLTLNIKVLHSNPCVRRGFLFPRIRHDTALFQLGQGERSSRVVLFAQLLTENLLTDDASWPGRYGFILHAITIRETAIEISREAEQGSLYHPQNASRCFQPATFCNMSKVRLLLLHAQDTRLMNYKAIIR